MQVKKQQLEMDMEQWTGSKLGKEYVKAVYCHPVVYCHIKKGTFFMLIYYISNMCLEIILCMLTYMHPVYLTYMQSTSWGMLDWMKHKLESRLP